MPRKHGSVNRNTPAIHSAVHYLGQSVKGNLTAGKAKRLLEDPGHRVTFYLAANIDPRQPPAWSTIERWIYQWREVPYDPSASFNAYERANAYTLLREDPFRYSVKTWRELYPFMNQSMIYRLRREEDGPRIPEWRQIAAQPYAMLPIQRRKLFSLPQPDKRMDPDQHDLFA